MQAAARGQQEKSRAVVQKRKSSAVQNFSIYYYIRLDTIGQDKNQDVLQFFFAVKMPLPRNNAATNKNAKKPRRIVNEMTNILVKMTDIFDAAKMLASGEGFAYNDK